MLVKLLKLRPDVSTDAGRDDEWEEEEDGEDDDGDHQSGECHRTLHSFPGLEQRVVLSVLWVIYIPALMSS